MFVNIKFKNYRTYFLNICLLFEYCCDKINLLKFLCTERRRFLWEAVRLAQYVYEECFVNGRDVEEILSDDPRKTEAILATYMLFLNNGNGDVGMPS